jgi:hypothetical protein
MLGGDSAPPEPIFSLTTKCGVETGGWVCVWCAAPFVLDALVVLEALGLVAALVDEVADAAELELDDAAELELDVVDDDGAGLDVLEWWLLDPHAVASSATISAAAVRLTIGPA